MKTEPLAALEIVAAARTIYPQPFATQVAGRLKRRLGDHFELTNFGVNLTQLAPGAVSALLHHHTRQDEFVFIVSGTPTLVLDDKDYLLQPGDCCGFKAGKGVGHQLVNKSRYPVQYLEIGDRSAGDYAEYPKDDLKFTQIEGGAWILTHKDGMPYEVQPTSIHDTEYAAFGAPLNRDSMLPSPSTCYAEIVCEEV